MIKIENKYTEIQAICFRSRKEIKSLFWGGVEKATLKEAFKVHLTSKIQISEGKGRVNVVLRAEGAWR